MRQRAADAALRSLARRDNEEGVSGPLQNAAEERERAVEAEEMHWRTANAAMLRAERLAAGEDVCAVAGVDEEGDGESRNP